MNNKGRCPDRCDIEFIYEWNHTNLSYNVLDSQPQYILSAGDSLSVTLKNVSPTAVYVLNNGNKLELTDDGNNTWSGTIPSDWISSSTFEVILEKGTSKLLLWEGLLNQVASTNESWQNTIYGLVDTFIQSGSNGLTVTRNSDGEFIISTNDKLLDSSDESIGIEDNDGTYDLTCKCDNSSKSSICGTDFYCSINSICGKGV